MCALFKGFRVLGLLSLVLAFSAVAPPSAMAQVGSTTDIILGRVTGPDSLPLENAQVAVTSAESGETRRRLTNAKGQYSIVFPDGGGNYTLRVTYLGMAPFQTTIQRQADEDRLVANVQMSPRPSLSSSPPSSSAASPDLNKSLGPKPATPNAACPLA